MVIKVQNIITKSGQMKQLRNVSVIWWNHNNVAIRKRKNFNKYRKLFLIL